MFFKRNYDKLPNKVALSTQAYLSVVSEVSTFSDIETGGIFLGTIENNNWYIIESIDPGYEKIIREVAYFVYDVDYVNHLANIRSKLYDQELVLLGLWHRHPGSMDVFSTADEDTNRKFVSNCTNGSISSIINIDPLFRITMYYVSPNLHYTKLKNIKYGDKYIPSKLLNLKNANVFLEKINKKSNNTPSKFQEKLLDTLDYEYISYLSQQKNYEYKIRMIDDKIELDMKRINTSSDVLPIIFIELFISNESRIDIRFNKKEVFEYKKNIICSYITNNGMIKNE
jgi:hypothetical protein